MKRKSIMRKRQSVHSCAPFKLSASTYKNSYVLSLYARTQPKVKKREKVLGPEAAKLCHTTLFTSL